MPENDKSSDNAGDDKNQNQNQDDNKTKTKTKDSDKVANLVSMPQEQLDEMITGRVDRAKNQALSALAKKQGYDSVDQMVEAVKEAKKREDKDKTELQKAQEKASKEERARLDVEAEVADVLTKSKFEVLAAQKGINDPEGAWFIAKGAGMINATVDVEAKTVKGLEADINALIEAKPYLVQGDNKAPKPPNTQHGPSNPPKAGGGGTEDTTDQFLNIIKGRKKTPE